MLLQTYLSKKWLRISLKRLKALNVERLIWTSATRLIYFSLYVYHIWKKKWFSLLLVVFDISSNLTRYLPKILLNNVHQMSSTSIGLVVELLKGYISQKYVYNINLFIFLTLVPLYQCHKFANLSQICLTYLSKATSNTLQPA